MSKSQSYDLTFPKVQYGKKETPWDLSILLYRGGAEINMLKFRTLVSQGLLGEPIHSRLPIVLKFHEVISARLIGGGSRFTAKLAIAKLRSFFKWLDTSGFEPTLSSIEIHYIAWTEYLIERYRVREITAHTVYHSATYVAGILNEIFDLNSSLLLKTRVRMYKKLRRILGTQADKQVLTETYAFGNALLDITKALSVEAVHGKLPISINFRTGQIIQEWCGLIPAENVKTLAHGSRAQIRNLLNSRKSWDSDITLRRRYPLTNLRIEAELLTFIAQTGMNLAQAYKLKIGNFSYRSHNDGYQVRRVYKNRRRGEIEFEIYSEYRAMLERYLIWRRALFPDSEYLFPLWSPQGRSAEVAPPFKAIQRICQKLELVYVGPRAIRKTRINWLLRRSRNPSLTAEMSQHTERTLLSQYEQPHHQVAIIEVSRFLISTDPAFIPPGPGACANPHPEAIAEIPVDAPRPDCISPAGCMFCVHQRDLDSADHIWSLTSYRYFKSLELSRYRPAINAERGHPAEAVIKRITLKLKYFDSSNSIRSGWVNEANARINEGDFHPQWDGFIQLMEIRK